MFLFCSFPIWLQRQTLQEPSESETSIPAYWDSDIYPYRTSEILKISERGLALHPFKLLTPPP